MHTGDTMKKGGWIVGVLLVLAHVSLDAEEPKPGGLKIEAPGVLLRLGVLLQPQFESAGSALKDGQSRNVFIRRIRLLFGGTVAKSFEFFLETDSPDLGKADANGSKTASFSGLKIQDMVLTWKVSDDVRVDAGLLLVPGAHLSNQGATTLNGLDYGRFAFDQSALMENNGGRDTGLMVRANLFGKRVETRLGVFQGKRKAAAGSGLPSGNALRFAGRVQLNLLDAEGGLFLAGTYGGARKILSLGAAHDRQGDFRLTSLDLFLDVPVGPHVLTAQADAWMSEGEGFWLFPKRTAWFAEASFRHHKSKLAPLFRFERRDVEAPTSGLLDESRVGVGLAWWFKGHTGNLKAFWQRVTSSAPGAALSGYSQFNLQWQLYYY